MPSHAAGTLDSSPLAGASFGIEVNIDLSAPITDEQRRDFATFTSAMV